VLQHLSACKVFSFSPITLFFAFSDCFSRPAIFWPPQQQHVLVRRLAIRPKRIEDLGPTVRHLSDSRQKHYKIHRLSHNPRMRLPRSVSRISGSHNDADMTECPSIARRLVPTASLFAYAYCSLRFCVHPLHIISTPV
jgi:hypothetical protein